MKSACVFLAVCLIAFCAGHAITDTATNRFVVKDNPGADYPYDTWDNAAPDIQTAINNAIAANGDEVVVAPGVYDSGATWDGANNNRVFLNKPLTVRSRDNDPATAIIQGAWDPVSNNGPLAVRCVWMSTGARLIGFTVTNGATASTTESSDHGGGIRCSSLDSIVSNCVITGCSANFGGGVGSGTLHGCRVEYNRAYRGGGTYASRLHNSIVRRNQAWYGDANRRGGGIYQGSAYNCLVEENETSNSGGAREATLYNSTIVNNVGGTSAGTRECTLWNCIVFNNACYEDTEAYFSRGESSQYQLNNCTQADPGFLSILQADWRLHDSSPCRDTGTNQAWMATACDLNGNPRLNGTVDMGCYEYHSEVQHVCHVVQDNPNAAEPYDTWDNAAADIQTAIDAASDLVLVAPGRYDAGGRPAGDGTVTNRIVIPLGITVQAADPDPRLTVIQGRADPPSTNWAGARCVYMTDRTRLVGFTVAGGAVPTNSIQGSFLPSSDDKGGGVFCEGRYNEIEGCILTGNMASLGGGAYSTYSAASDGLTLHGCLVEGNHGYQGGGVARATAYNSTIRDNRTINNNENNRAGGLFDARAYNCLVVSNRVYSAGGGAGRKTTFHNCTIVANLRGTSHTSGGAGLRECTLYNSISWNQADYSDTAAFFSCGQDPAIYTPENNCLSADPLFRDTGWRLQGRSPCVNAGDNASWMVDALDLDGKPRLDSVHKRVDMGCYELPFHGTMILIR